jgi:hypothetical protein
LLLSRKVGHAGRVFAFEPEPESFMERVARPKQLSRVSGVSPALVINNFPMANARTDIGVNTGVEGSSRCQAPTEGASCRVLIPFSTPHLYGMERAVIEIFDALRPDVEPCFVQGSLIYKAGLPVSKRCGKEG